MTASLYEHENQNARKETSKFGGISWSQERKHAAIYELMLVYKSWALWYFLKKLVGELQWLKPT